VSNQLLILQIRKNCIIDDIM